MNWQKKVFLPLLEWCIIHKYYRKFDYLERKSSLFQLLINFGALKVVLPTKRGNFIIKKVITTNCKIITAKLKLASDSNIHG